MEVEALFKRFPSVQNVPFGDAYKPGLDRMMAFDELLGHPSGAFKTIHIAGTNGKGSVANMLAANLAASGYKTGLYTSPHILDFRERMRIKDGSSPVSMVPEDYVLDFIQRYRPDFERLSLSFFEITTGMAFKWFADCGVDWAVVEVGLGGRLDSTNIITPELSVITSIGLDHCALLGNTLAEIAAEKAGIIKPGVPVVVGHRDPETDPVFVARAADAGSRLVFAASGPLPALRQKLLTEMDLQGRCQAENLGTVAAALSELGIPLHPDAIAHTAVLMDFHGRWEKLSDEPLVICDIGHNPPALKENFAQLREMLRAGYSDLIIVYAVMADKDLGSILPLMPPEASYIFTTPKTARALPAEEISHRFESFLEGRCSSAISTCSSQHSSAIQLSAVPAHIVVPDVADAVRTALKQAAGASKPVIYIGGSTFAVAEALPVFKK